MLLLAIIIQWKEIGWGGSEKSLFFFIHTCIIWTGLILGVIFLHAYVHICMYVCMLYVLCKALTILELIEETKV